MDNGCCLLSSGLHVVHNSVGHRQVTRLSHYLSSSWNTLFQSSKVSEFVLYCTQVLCTETKEIFTFDVIKTSLASRLRSLLSLDNFLSSFGACATDFSTRLRACAFCFGFFPLSSSHGMISLGPFLIFKTEWSLQSCFALNPLPYNSFQVEREKRWRGRGRG